MAASAYICDMNEHAPRSRRVPTQAAEGLPRWRWTLAEFDRFIELGVFTGDDKVELIGGELVPMSPKGVKHETLKEDLQDWFQERLPKSVRLRTELGWRPDSETYCEPNLVLFAAQRRHFATAPAREVVLLVEVADASLKFDTQTKALLYARLGVAEYWVINVVNLETRVHRQPGGGKYGYVRRIAPTRALSPGLLPDLTLRLADVVQPSA